MKNNQAGYAWLMLTIYHHINNRKKITWLLIISLLIAKLYGQTALSATKPTTPPPLPFRGGRYCSGFDRNPGNRRNGYLTTAHEHQRYIYI